MVNDRLDVVGHQVENLVHPYSIGVLCCGTSRPSLFRKEAADWSFTGTSGGAAGPAFGSLSDYQLSTGSPAINAGVAISGSGGVDFWGDAIVGTPDIGAYESP